MPTFRYLGIIATPSKTIDEAVVDIIDNAAWSLGRLRNRVIQNKQLKRSTKTKVYGAVCISTFLCGAEAWTSYQYHLKQLHRFHICFQRILGRILQRQSIATGDVTRSDAKENIYNNDRK